MTPSSAWRARRLAGVLVLGLTAGLYCYDLGRAPVYLGGDEAHFGVHAYAIAQTGHDLDGRSPPLFFNLFDPRGDPHDVDTGRRWYQPILFYVIALALKVLPFNEASIRLPAALVGGLLNPLLMYAVGRRLLTRRADALLAAVLLAWSPPHLLLSREAVDYVCLLPFVLGWLWCLLASMDADNAWLSLAAGLLLGAGFYSYIAAWVLMPLFLLVTWIAYSRSGRVFGRLHIAAGVGFALPLAPLVPWLWSHPAMLQDTFGRYRAPGVGPLRAYLSSFNPSFLFVRGGPSMTTSTNRAGVFLLPVAVLLPIGVYELLMRQRRAAITFVLLAGIAIAPIPAALAGEPSMIQRELLVLPFGAFLAAFGFARWRQSSRPAIRALAVVLLTGLPLQFAYVYHDYFTHYERRSAFYYDPSAFRDVAEYVIPAAMSGPAPAVYLSSEMDDVGVRWRFYVTKYGRQDLLARTRYFGAGDLELGAASGSLLVMYAESHDVDALIRTGQWSVAKKIFDVDGRAASVVLKKA